MCTEDMVIATENAKREGVAQVIIDVDDLHKLLYAFKAMEEKVKILNEIKPLRIYG